MEYERRRNRESPPVSFLWAVISGSAKGGTSTLSLLPSSCSFGRLDKKPLARVS
ncbi:hypothetical protein DPMN_071094 [Dreissena polymorpha]|uniref:Uncharacterized protein n=1 Tax=Dreissena polymorpha TaxID=45954 RepID=A0A9D4BVH5_DREPO|nr:hypothetical protein DPMN_071094 [Dreissena polymorpha]